jgi:mono/diheme cytochrome c family protein
VLLLLAACSHMRNQPKFETFEPNPFFEDGAAARPLVPNTVARGRPVGNSHLTAGLVDGAPAQDFPFPVTMTVLERGQDRYNIFCSPCHGYDGYGQGQIVQRGLSPPPSLHIERLRAAPEGHYFNVITNGFGTMYSYAARVKPDDRWAIIAYIRALQLSQNAPLAEIPADEQSRLEAQPVEGGN